MDNPRVQAALSFIESVDIPPGPSERGLEARAVPEVIGKVKDQAMVVGSDIVSFVDGTAPELRTPIMHSALLAQLAANRKVPSRDRVEDWYEAYFDVLEQIGWVIQDRAFSEHREGGDTFEAHQAILTVAATILGPATTALAVVTSTLDAMKQMSEGPWMTIFQQESQSAKAARFQVTVAEPASAGGVTISLMAFTLKASAQLTQVLFFKFRSLDAVLRHSSGKVAIDQQLLSAVAPAIARKVGDHVGSYVENIPI